MRPFDPRLLRQVPALRRDAVLLLGCGVGVALAIIAAASALATALGALPALDTRALSGFVLAFGARALVTSACGVVAARMAATVKASLRTELLAATGRRGPSWLAGERAGELATLTGRGMDALDDYFTGYLPQLVFSVTIPVAVLIMITTADLASAAIILVTLPLIPIFGILIGWQTRAATDRQWRRLRMLGGHFLDMVAGLPTLRAFGRAHSQVTAVRRMADRHRVATMKTLRIAFLSALVLELVGTIAVALVAVPIGLRLLAGGMALSTALLILLLTPEAFAPLRTAGTKFHASMEGLTALDQAFTLLHDAGDRLIRERAPSPAPDPAQTGIEPDQLELAGVTVEYDRTMALHDVDLTIEPGERIALVGRSGSGKSTLLSLLLGFVTPTRGRILIDGHELSTLDLDWWRSRLAWVPQRPHLFAATLAENIALGAPQASRDAISKAADAAALPHDLDIRLGEHGLGLSSGERQRVALARAFLRDAPILLLDEPTARLDVASEEAVLDATERLIAGRTALLVAHRPALLRLATRTIEVEQGRLRARAGVPA